MKFLKKLSALVKIFLSLPKNPAGKKSENVQENVFQIMENIKFDEYGNPDFTYK
ncbi:MAG: hypothetical protein ACXVPN_11960 [Bacteroidia bacterium]